MKHLWCLILVNCLPIYGQTWQETSIGANTAGQRYDDIFFINENIGWAANGFFAAVYKTEDGGLTWTKQLDANDLPGNYYFRNIEFLDENLGFLGTLNNRFFKSVDGGSSWQEVTTISPNPNAICGLDAVSSSIIYGCGAYFGPACVIKSTDAGDTWQYIDMSALADGLVEILFINELLGYVAGRCDTGACVLKTTDGGLNWQEVYNSGNAGEFVWKLQVINNDNDVIFGALQSVTTNPGKLIKSIDSGNTWQSLDAPETNIQAVGFINENQGWMGGHNTGIYATDDGGMTWTDTGVGSNLNRIFIIDDDLAFASGTSIYKFTEETLSSTENSMMIDGLDLVTLDRNPVDRFLDIKVINQVGDNFLLDIYDINGIFVSRLKRVTKINQTETKSYSFDISYLSSGIYFLNIHNNLGQRALKFIKK